MANKITCVKGKDILRARNENNEVIAIAGQIKTLLAEGILDKCDYSNPEHYLIVPAGSSAGAWLSGVPYETREECETALRDM